MGINKRRTGRKGVYVCVCVCVLLSMHAFQVGKSEEEEQGFVPEKNLKVA